jgi:hypothetical protein
MGLNSVPANPFDHDAAEPEDCGHCCCKAPAIWFEISEGELSWGCDACNKPMSDWFLETVCMDPIKVSFRVEPGHCTCNMHDQLHCDCDQWPVVKPMSEGEG